jgi:hypothetical protein
VTPTTKEINMGTDIHSRAEVRSYDGGWRMIADPVFKNDYFHDERPVSERNVPYLIEPLNWRNYELFALLADVRNGRGFAGVDTGERITPVLGFEEPTRGVPADASEEWKKIVEDWGADMHSVSWLTLAELMAIDLTAPVVHRGIIDPAQYLKIRESGFVEKPTAWYGYGSKPVITPAQYDQGVTHIDGIQADVSYQWETTLGDGVPELARVIPELTANALKIGQHPGWGQTDTREPDYESIRVVFGFDN